MFVWARWSSGTVAKYHTETRRQLLGTCKRLLVCVLQFRGVPCFFHPARARILPVCHGEMADCGAGRAESQDECVNKAYRLGTTRCRDIFCWFCFWCQHASSQSMLIQKCCANISMYGSDLAFPKACRCYPNRTQRQLAGACKR